MRLAPGVPAPSFHVDTVHGHPVTLQEFEGKPLLLRFYRYASCPMCLLRLHDFCLAYPRLHAKGLEAVAFFHSSADRIRTHAGDRDCPVPLGADPTFRVYRSYGVETSWPNLVLSAMRPSFYVDWVRAMGHGFWGGASWRMGTMPADFLIDATGRIVVAYYGRDIGDHLGTAAIEDFLDHGRTSGRDARA